MSQPRATLADAMDGVRWDYDPARQILSPLVATARWFEGFPWDGEESEGEDERVKISAPGPPRG